MCECVRGVHGLRAWLRPARPCPTLSPVCRILLLFFLSAISLKHFYFISLSWLYYEARRILVPRPGIEPASPAMEVQSPNDWTTREVTTLCRQNNCKPTSQGHGASAGGPDADGQLRALIVVQLLSRVQLFETPRTAAHQAPLSCYLPELAQIHAYRVGDAIQPTHPLSAKWTAVTLGQGGEWVCPVVCPVLSRP